MNRLTTTLFLWVGLAMAGCAGSLESSLEDARDAHRPPPDLRVVYDDHSGLTGGERIEVVGQTLRWWKLRPGFVEATPTPETLLGGPVQLGPTPTEPPSIERPLDANALLALVDLLLSIEPWDQRASDDATRLDQRRAILHAEVAAGGETMWEWHDELEAPDARVGRVRAWAQVVTGESPEAVATPPVNEPESEERPGTELGEDGAVAPPR